MIESIIIVKRDKLLGGISSLFIDACTVQRELKIIGVEYFLIQIMLFRWYAHHLNFRWHFNVSYLCS